MFYNLNCYTLVFSLQNVVCLHTAQFCRITQWCRNCNNPHWYARQGYTPKSWWKNQCTYVLRPGVQMELGQQKYHKTRLSDLETDCPMFDTYWVHDKARRVLISRHDFHMLARCAWDSMRQTVWFRDRLSDFETDCLTWRQTVPKESRQQNNRLKTQVSHAGCACDRQSDFKRLCAGQGLH